jgi:hypothetical protein
VWVKWDPLDLSYVLVRHPRSDQWVTALADGGPDLQITAMEYRRLRRWLAAEHQAMNRTTLRLARERMRQLEAEAVDAKDRLVREARRGRATEALRRALAPPNPPVPTVPGPAGPPDPADGLAPDAAVEGLPDL